MKLEHKAVAAIAITMFGCFQAAGPFVDVYPAYTGGLIALAGGIWTVDLLQSAKEADPEVPA
jgi:hypothetical protein